MTIKVYIEIYPYEQWKCRWEEKPYRVDCDLLTILLKVPSNEYIYLIFCFMLVLNSIVGYLKY